jgi:putative RecB family exonuclease
MQNKKNNNIYSHSKISCFEQCPLKFKFKYIDKIKILERSIEALLGFCVHSVLEYLYNEKKLGKNPSIDEIITIYSDCWKENYNENIKIVKKDLNSKDYFNKGIKFLMNYYTQNYPFEDNTIETEKKVEIMLGENKKLIGYIDRLVQNSENKKIEIHDYKTANNLPMQKDIDNDRQLALYSLAIKEEFGKNKDITLVWHYLAHNKKIISKRTEEQLENLKKEILEIIEKIESAENFPPCPSKLCDWCEYKKICPVWNSENKENNNGENQKLNQN